jgi:hypothetical protein
MKSAIDEQQQECVGCGVLSPKTETNFTLISSRYGWRLTRTFTLEGRKLMQWRCPACFARYRAGSPPTASGPPPASTRKP